MDHQEEVRIVRIEISYWNLLDSSSFNSDMMIPNDRNVYNNIRILCDYTICES
jgi:hypothetical protein